MTKHRVLAAFSAVGLLLLMVSLLACARAASTKAPLPEVGVAAQEDRRTAGLAPMATPAPLTQGKSAESSEVVSAISPGSFLSDQMVVYTTSMTLVVKDVEQGLMSVEEVAQWAGGYVSNSNLRQEGRYKVVTVTIRVPANRYRDVMGRLRQLAVEVRGENASAKDVGEEYADLDAQVKNLEATEARYIQLLQKANTIDEILRVQQRISEVRDRIDRIRGRMNYLQRQSDYATITLNLQPEAMVKGIGGDEVWDPLKIAQEAWEALMGWWRGVATLLIRLVIFTWWIGVLAIIALFLWGRRSRPGGSQPEAKQ